MIQKILTPLIHALLAMMLVVVVLRLTVAEPGPALAIFAAIAGALGFISGVVRVRRGPETAAAKALRSPPRVPPKAAAPR